MDYYKDYLDRLIINEENGSEFNDNEITIFFKNALTGALDRVYGFDGKIKTAAINYINNSDINLKEIYNEAINNNKSYKLDNSRINNVGKLKLTAAVDTNNISSNDIENFFTILGSRLKNINGNRSYGFIYEILVFIHIKQNKGGKVENIKFSTSNSPISDLILNPDKEHYNVQCKWTSNPTGIESFNEQFGHIRKKLFGQENLYNISNYIIISGNRYKNVMYVCNKSAIDKIKNFCEESFKAGKSIKGDGMNSEKKGTKLRLHKDFFDNNEFFNNNEEWKGFASVNGKNYYTFSITEDKEIFKTICTLEECNNFLGEIGGNIVYSNVKKALDTAYNPQTAPYKKQNVNPIEKRAKQLIDGFKLYYSDEKRFFGIEDAKKNNPDRYQKLLNEVIKKLKVGVKEEDIRKKIIKKYMVKWFSSINTEDYFDY